MGRETIAEIKYKLRERDVTELELSTLKQDERKGVQELLVRFERERKAELEARNKFEEMMVYERKTHQQGRTCVAGIDEAGRGPLAGPVVAGAVVLPDGFYVRGLNDSKKLTPSKREFYYDILQKEAMCGIGVASNEEIDEINIYQAAKLAMERAVRDLHMPPEHLLIDAMTIDLDLPQTKLIKGDERSVSIAAASIIAKVTRDRIMAEIDSEYPHYYFGRNQGYGTSDHLQALMKYGPTPYHRKSFSPVREVSHKEG